MVLRDDLWINGMEYGQDNSCYNLVVYLIFMYLITLIMIVDFGDGLLTQAWFLNYKKKRVYLQLEA